MSKFPAGIFSKARGKLSGIVFSAARTREGKLMTARQLVIPANPQTPAQQSNRMIFDYVQGAVRSLGTGIYRQDWNRGVEDLPGYQSLISLVRRQYNQLQTNRWIVENTNPDTLLGDLHLPEIIDVAYDSGQVFVDWSTEPGTNGQADDDIVILVFMGDVDNDFTSWWQVLDQSHERSDGDAVINVGHVFQGGNPLVAFYARNRDNKEEEQLSAARWIQAVDL